MAGLVAVLDQAVKRYGANPGFNVVIGLIYNEQLFDLIENGPTEDLTGSALARQLVSVLQEREQLWLITDITLKLKASRQEEGKDAIEADRAAHSTYL